MGLDEKYVLCPQSLVHLSLTSPTSVFRVSTSPTVKTIVNPRFHISSLAAVAIQNPPTPSSVRTHPRPIRRIATLPPSSTHTTQTSSSARCSSAHDGPKPHSLKRKCAEMAEYPLHQNQSSPTHSQHSSTTQTYRSRCKESKAHLAPPTMTSPSHRTSSECPPHPPSTAPNTTPPPPSQPPRSPFPSSARTNSARTWSST